MLRWVDGVISFCSTAGILSLVLAFVMAASGYSNLARSCIFATGIYVLIIIAVILMDIFVQGRRLKRGRRP
jgi:uncharacterized membrane protein YhaH (DUF805 family)